MKTPTASYRGRIAIPRENLTALLFHDPNVTKIEVADLALQAEALFGVSADLPGFFDDLAVELHHGNALGDVQIKVVPLAKRLGSERVLLGPRVGIIAYLKLVAVHKEAGICALHGSELQTNDAVVGVRLAMVNVAFGFLDVEVNATVNHAPAVEFAGPPFEVFAVVEAREAGLEFELVAGATRIRDAEKPEDQHHRCCKMS